MTERIPQSVLFVRKIGAVYGHHIWKPQSKEDLVFAGFVA